MKILITNVDFESYSGTVVVARDLASAFLRAGHQPVIFSPHPGAIAAEVRSEGIQIVDHLALLTAPPDIIHGHHHRALAEALLYFPDVPAVYLCHDATSQMDEPTFFPRVVRYLAVDERCRARIERTLGPAAGQVRIMPNAVDLGRFPPRGPLPPRPRKAIVFSNYARRGTHLNAVRKACRLADLDLDVMGAGTGTQSADPGRVLVNYDVVFAKARCALEALAVGNAVVLCDFAGAGPCVTSRELDRLRAMNFGAGVLTGPLDPKAIARQIGRYDPVDAAEVSRRIRSEAGLESATDTWIELYEEVIAGFDPMTVDREAEYRAHAEYLSRWHYLNRRIWERKQLERLMEIPLVGKAVYGTAVWALRRTSSRFHEPI